MTCNNTSVLVATLNIDHDSCDWRFFIDSSRTTQSFFFPSSKWEYKSWILLDYTVHMKEIHDYIKKLRWFKHDIISDRSVEIWKLMLFWWFFLWWVHKALLFLFEWNSRARESRYVRKTCHFVHCWSLGRRRKSREQMRKDLEVCSRPHQDIYARDVTYHLKINFLESHLDFFPLSCKPLSDEHSELFF